MGWTVPLQRAAYRGVRFEVINITDSFERTLAEHAYPFVNGADLEEMGLQPRCVQLQAVFFGEGYYTSLMKLLEALQKSGSDVLVHPIFGRMPNMICQSASLKHGDEFVDYVALDLTFVEATEAKPIFAFEHSLLSEIDKLLNQLDDLIDEVLALFAEVMQVIAFAQNAKSRLLKAWSALVGVYESVLSLCGLDATKYRISVGVSPTNFVAHSRIAAKQLNEMVSQHLNEVAQVNQQEALFSIRSQFDEVLRQVAKLNAQPIELVSGKNASAKRAEKLQSLIASFSAKEMMETQTVLRLICSTALTRIGVGFIEAHAETLTPVEIDYIATQLRLNLAETVNAVRVLQQQDVMLSNPLSKPNTGVYTQTHQTLERLRNIAHAVSRLAIAAINRKPPLVVRRCELSGTIHQVAHAFYGDHSRADELLRLNPQIREPNFIVQGALLNAYAK